MPLGSVGTPALWISFALFVAAMLALDLGVFHRRPHEVRTGEALIYSGVWIALALLFNLAVYLWFGSERALEFLSGYLIEKALSVDNIFVFLVLFSTFRVPEKLKHRVLFLGIVGAVVMRAIFVLVGAAVLERFHWVSYLFGGLLIAAGTKLLLRRDGEVHPERNPIVRLFRRLVPSVDDYHGTRFTVVAAGKRYATPLLLVLVAIEVADMAFAADSIPAVFAVTNDPFIVFTSNVFAMLGLRSLFFALAGALSRFRFLYRGVSLVLVFVGVKMLLEPLYPLPTVTSLIVIATLLAGSMGASLFRKEARRERPRRPAQAARGAEVSS